MSRLELPKLMANLVLLMAVFLSVGCESRHIERSLNIHVLKVDWAGGLELERPFTYIFQLREGQGLVIPNKPERYAELYARNYPRFRLIKILNDSTALIQFCSSLTPERPIPRYEYFDSHFVLTTENAFFMSNDIDAGTDYYIRILRDSTYGVDLRNDTLPPYKETTEVENPLKGTISRRTYFPGGQLKAEWTEIFNKRPVRTRHGIYRQWQNNGCITKEIIYDSGKVISRENFGNKVFERDTSDSGI